MAASILVEIGVAKVKKSENGCLVVRAENDNDHFRQAGELKFSGPIYLPRAASTPRHENIQAEWGSKSASKGSKVVTSYLSRKSPAF